MSLIKWNNNNGGADFSRLLDSFFGSDVSDYLGNYSGTVPAVNIMRNERDYKLEMALPGFTKNAISIKIDNNVLIISGKKEDAKEPETGKYSRREFSYSSFQRSFHLPDTLDSDNIEAAYENGILQIRLPMKNKEKEKPGKTIHIN
ncbi:MAG: Hsp20/alpha crystallin family protein [Cytophagaceae bacterium]